MPDSQGGYSPTASNRDTEGVHPPVGTAPGSPGAPLTQAPRAGNQDTTGTSVAGVGAALPGGSVTDVIPWAGSGQAGGQTGQPPQSDYAVRGALPARYGWAPGSPDTEAVYGGPVPTAPVTPQSPYPWVPVSTMLTQTLDTQAGGGSALTAGLGTPPAYRAPGATVPASVKDTSLTDIMGNMVAAMPLTGTSYAAFNVDTSYNGAPAAPASLSTQTDTFSAAAAATNYYASQLGVIPASITMYNTTQSKALVSGTDFAVTSSGAGPKSSAYVRLTAGTNFAAGNTVTMTYQYGSPQYWDSNLPPATSQSNVDIFAISTQPVQLSAYGVTTAANALAVIDVTQGNVPLVYNTDYTVATITQAWTPGSTYSEVPPVTYAIALKVTSTIAKIGDTIQVTYAYSTSTPPAPTVGGGVSHTDNIVILATATALSTAGVITAPGSLQVVNNQAGANFGKTLVLNVDYTIVVSGSGATTAYTIARLGTSPNSALNDHVLVTYSTGNAAYWVSGGVQATDKGVYVPWAPPAGTIQVDYYMIQSSDLGTMFVPVTGQPVNYGQMTPAGGGSFGMPTYQSDTFTGAFSSATPNALSQTGIITPAGQLIVRNLTRVGADPLQPGSNVLIPGYDYTVTQTGIGTSQTYSIQRLATSVNSVNGDTITVGYWYDNMGSVPLTFVADAVTAVAGAATLHNKDIVVAPQNLIVYDTTKSKALAYGLDYTVTVTGSGPAESMTINLITTGPAGAGLTDALSVGYGYGIVLSAIYRQGLIPNQVPIYQPAGVQRPGGVGGYQLSVAAGNRAGLGPFSGWSDYVVPLNYSAPQPGQQGNPNVGTGTIDPRNSVNPIYKPDGTVKAGTGLGP